MKKHICNLIAVEVVFAFKILALGWCATAFVVLMIQFGISLYSSYGIGPCVAWLVFGVFYLMLAALEDAIRTEIDDEVRKHEAAKGKRI